MTTAWLVRKMAEGTRSWVLSLKSKGSEKKLKYIYDVGEGKTPVTTAWLVHKMAEGKRSWVLSLKSKGSEKKLKYIYDVVRIFL